MIILEDTRQQAKKHETKHRWFADHDILISRTKLFVGDYTLPTNQKVCIDTKQHIQELIQDIHVKTMPKGDVLAKVREIPVDRMYQDIVYHIITDDDEGRYPECEISKFCQGHGLSEDVEKLLQSLYVKRHGSFHREMKRAQNTGIRLIVLVENTDGIRTVRDLANWSDKAAWKRYNIQMSRYRKGKASKPPVEPQSGVALMKACLTMEVKYGVEIEFCTPEESASRIVKILKEGG